MAVSKYLSGLPHLLEDSQRILIILNKKCNIYTKLQLQIEFEYYHFQKGLSLTDITNRFNHTYDILLQNKVINLEHVQIQIDKAACARFIQKDIAT